MAEREKRGHLPEAMLDLGTPQEMSDWRDENGMDDASAPVLEITQPFHLGEGLEEIREPEDLVEDI